MFCRHVFTSFLTCSQCFSGNRSERVTLHVKKMCSNTHWTKMRDNDSGIKFFKTHLSLIDLGGNCTSFPPNLVWNEESQRLCWRETWLYHCLVSHTVSPPPFPNLRVWLSTSKELVKPGEKLGGGGHVMNLHPTQGEGKYSHTSDKKIQAQPRKRGNGILFTMSL